MANWLKISAKTFWTFLKKKRVKKIIDWSLFGFLLVVLAGVVVPLFPEAPYALKMVTSNSMRPAFSTGSLVVVIPEEHYEIGQVITYQASEYEEDIVTHRIIGQKEGGFITKGDANKIEDEKPVFQSQIQGRVAFYLPLVGYLISFFQRPIGFVLIVILPASFIIYGEIKKVMKEIKKSKVSL